MQLPKGIFSMAKRHLLSIANLEMDDVYGLIDRSVQFGSGAADGHEVLKGKYVGIYFRKTSTRTRTSFTIGAAKLGASFISYGPDDLQLNTGESVGDTGRVLSGYLDALVVRTAASLQEMEALSSQDEMAVINAMSENEHPTQAIADLATLKEHFGTLENLHVLYLGEGNNTAAALALSMARIPTMKITFLTPQGYGLTDEVTQQAQAFAAESGAVVEEYHNMEEVPLNVDVVYTTRWQTTGTSKPDPNWRNLFQPFMVTEALMQRVSKPEGTIFLHDLPAHRGEDVEDAVLDGPQSLAFRQARYKMFSAMAILEWCILG
jgi:ornithine carbamoyltransferase